MNKTLIALSLALASTGAAATYCQDGSTIESHPNGNCNYTPPKTPGFEGVKVEVSPNASSDAQAKAAAQSSASIKASQSTAVSNRQGQQQQQAQRQSLNNTNANQSAGGSVVIEGNQAGSGDRNTTFFLPPVIHGPSLPPMVSGKTDATVTPCSWRKEVWQRPVFMLVRNSFFPDEMTQVGWDDFTKDMPERFLIVQVPVGRDAYGAIIYSEMASGTQLIIKAEPLNSSSGASFSIGGVGGKGGGQFGGMDQGAVQQWVSNITAVECFIPVERVAPAPYTAPAAIPAPAPKPRPRKIIRRPVVASCGCVK